MSQVFAGKAVFVADGMESRSFGTTPDKQRFDFVKEMLNQVVPRKRTLKFNIAQQLLNPGNADDLPYKYDANNATAIAVPYIEETSGQFETDQRSRTSQALEIFRRSFGMGNTTLSDTSDIMKKVLKDYSHNMTDAQKSTYLYRIVEKETLVGTKARVPNWITGLFITPDNRINGVEGNTVNDTGLYELYKNVVEVFTGNMIKVADNYAGLESGSVSDRWRSRNNYGPKGCKNTNPPSCVDEHGPGMSYSFGGISDIETFNDQVSVWQAAPNAAYPKNPTNENDAAFYTRVLQHYRGNIDDTDGLMDNDVQDGDPTGAKKWAGLYSGSNGRRTPLTEYRLWENLFQNATCDSTFSSVIRNHAYYPLHWVGLDCAAFVQRVINAADPSTSGSITNPPDLKTNVMNLKDYEEKCAINNGVTTRDRAKRSWVEYFFTESNPKQRTYVSNIPETEGQDRANKLRLLRKGDLLQYPPSSGISHISVVYSDKPTCSSPNDSSTCTYEIIHAYGGTSYQPLNDVGAPVGDPIFSRKVIKTKQNIGSAPAGFGRIKLWD